MNENQFGPAHPALLEDPAQRLSRLIKEQKRQVAALLDRRAKNCNRCFGNKVVQTVPQDTDEKTKKLVPITKPFTPGRNQPCPCHSGKKYKRCCAGNQEQQRVAVPCTCRVRVS